MKFSRISLILCIYLFLTLSISAVDNSFKLDFDGDGGTDIAVYREGSRLQDLVPQASFWYFFNTRTGQSGAIGWGRTLDIPAPADYDNDGKTDTAIYRWWDFANGDTNEWWISRSSGGTQTLVFEPGYHKFSRNYIGDGRAEIGQLYQTDINRNPANPCNISFYFVTELSVGGNSIRKQVGEACNVIPTPVPGDYNNDGRSDLAVFDNNTFKVWFPPYSSAATAPDVVQTLNVDFPAPGDYDGDGKTDFAGTTARNGRLIWTIKQSGTGEVIETDFGLAGDKPVPGDYNADGKTDLAVFRPSNSSWWIKNSGTGIVNLFYFGLATDTPLAMPVIPFNPTGL
jgi:FG-GAP-like repeat